MKHRSMKTRGELSAVSDLSHWRKTSGNYSNVLYSTKCKYTKLWMIQDWVDGYISALANKKRVPSLVYVILPNSTVCIWSIGKYNLKWKSGFYSDMSTYSKMEVNSLLRGYANA